MKQIINQISEEIFKQTNYKPNKQTVNRLITCYLNSKLNSKSSDFIKDFLKTNDIKKMKCKKCNKLTAHLKCGYGKRYRCLICGEEI